MTSTNKTESRVNARLDADITRKLHELMRLEGKGVSDVIKQSIAHYHAMVCRASTAPGDALRESGFIGCANGEAGLSADYKRALTKALARKHGHR